MPDVINRQNKNRQVSDDNSLEQFISDVTASLGLTGPSGFEQLQASGEAEREALKSGDGKAFFEAAMKSPFLGFGVGSLKGIKSPGLKGARLKIMNKDKINIPEHKVSNPRGLSKDTITAILADKAARITKEAKAFNRKESARKIGKANKNLAGLIDTETGEISRFKGGVKPSQDQLMKMALKAQAAKAEEGGNFLLSIEKKASRVETAKQETKRLKKVEDEAFKAESAIALEKRRQGRKKFIRFLNVIPEDSPIRKDLKSISDAGFEANLPPESAGVNSLIIFPKGKAGSTPLLQIDNINNEMIVHGRVLGPARLKSNSFEEAVALVNRLLNPTGKGK